MSRVLHDGRDDGLEPLESLDLQQTQGFADLLRRMAKTAFAGRELGEAFHVLRAMADDPDCTRVLTISGAMSIAKMGLIVCQMIDAGLVQIIISTGAIMAHGLSEAIGCVHYKHDPKISDKQLFDWGYNRVYDTLEMESNLWHAQQVVSQVLDEIDWSRPTCSWQLNREIGRKLFEQGQMPSILGTAYRKEVPVFVPAFTDSELGLDVATHFLAKKVPRPARSRASRSRLSTSFAPACRRTIRSSISTNTRSESIAPSGWAFSPSAAACRGTGPSRLGRSTTSSTCGWAVNCPCRASATACGFVLSRSTGVG